jgi:hypothetical protein
MTTLYFLSNKKYYLFYFNSKENGNENRTNDDEASVVTPDLNVNIGDIHCTDMDLNLNFDDKHRTGLGQNTGDKHGTEANKIDVGNPTTMPEVPDRNTSNKTLKGGEVTQDKDQNNPAVKTDGDNNEDDNEDTTGYESAKYAKHIDDKDKV